MRRNGRARWNAADRPTARILSSPRDNGFGYLRINHAGDFAKGRTVNHTHERDSRWVRRRSVAGQRLASQAVQFSIRPLEGYHYNALGPGGNMREKKIRLGHDLTSEKPGWTSPIGLVSNIMSPKRPRISN